MMYQMPVKYLWHMANDKEARNFAETFIAQNVERRLLEETKQKDVT